MIRTKPHPLLQRDALGYSHQDHYWEYRVRFEKDAKDLRDGTLAEMNRMMRRAVDCHFTHDRKVTLLAVLDDLCHMLLKD